MVQRSMSNATMTFVYDDGSTCQLRPHIVTRAEYDADRVLASSNSAFLIRELDNTFTTPILAQKLAAIYHGNLKIVRVLVDDLEIWAKR